MLQYWLELKDIMLSEIGQLQKDKYCMVLLKEGWLQGAEGGKNGKLFNGTDFPCYRREVVVMVVEHCECA